MTAVTAPARARWLHVAAPAFISVITYLALDVLVARFVGRPDSLWSEQGYRMSMNALVLLRLGPLMFSGALVWPLMRARGASRTVAAIGVLATPIAFAIVSGIGALTYFPPIDAAYYATNPIVIGSFGSQVAMAGLGSLIAAWHRAGWRASPRNWWSWPAVAAFVLGEIVLVASVIWHGGVYVFYAWIQVYRAFIG